jgi:hypothetical protein
VAKIIHQELGKKYGICTNAVPYYKYQPSAVLDNQVFTLYWYRTIYTARTVSNNRPDITLIDKAAKKVTLIDIAIVNTHNLESTHNHKINKYMNLQSEIKAQWQVDHVKIVLIVLYYQPLASSRITFMLISKIWIWTSSSTQNYRSLSSSIQQVLYGDFRITTHNTKQK